MIYLKTCNQQIRCWNIYIRIKNSIHLLSYNSTKRAIKENEKLIHTTAISALDFSWLLDKGYKIYLHENGKVGEVYEGVTKLTDKELRKGHDIRKIWIGGGFEDYFYGK